MRRISLIPLLFAVPAVASAEEASPPDATIVVTGQGLETPPGAAAYGAVVIQRERLTGDASGRLEDVLRDVAGFQQFRRTDSRAANPTSQGATLRAMGGNASSRALVLLDGVPQADPFTGYIPFSALAPDRLTAARVTRGGGAGPFGAGAVAGTIELFSAGLAELPRLSAEGAYGSRDSTELSAGLAAPVGNGFVTLSGNWDRGDGYVLIPEDRRGPIDVPSRYESWSVAARGVASLDADTELQARALAFDDQRLRGQPNTDSQSRGADASLRLVHRGAWNVDALAYIQDRGFASKFVSTAANRASNSLTLDQFNTPSTGIGGKLELRPPVGEAHVLRLGGDIRSATGRTNELFRYQSGSPTRIRRAGGKTLNAGLFVEDDWRIGELTLTGGARLDRWEIRGGYLTETEFGTGAPVSATDYADRSGWRPSGRVGALYGATSALDLRAAAYTGFRLPTLNELYRPFRVGADATAANADLRLEKLKGVEAGFDYRPLSAAHLGLTLFWNELSDAIANVTVANGPGVFPQVGFVSAAGVFRQRQNVDAIRVKGLEATAALDLADWRLSASYALSDARVKTNGLSAALDGKRPAQSPVHQASATLGWKPVSGADLSATLRYVSGQYEDDLQTRRLPDAVTVDAAASVALAKGLRLIARGENLFDEQVVSGISGDGLIDLGTPRTLWIGFALAR